MPRQHLPQCLLDKQPNPHREQMSLCVSAAIDRHFSGCPRWGISAAVLCAVDVSSPVRTGLKEAQPFAMLRLLQGLTTIWQHPSSQAGTFNDVPAAPQMHIADHAVPTQQSLDKKVFGEVLW